MIALKKIKDTLFGLSFQVLTQHAPQTEKNKMYIKNELN